MSRTNPGVELVIETLAVYRATRLLQRDDLPPLPEIREKLMDRYGASPWSALIDCPWCLGVWVGGASALLRAVAPRLWRIGATVLASSAVAGLISEWVASMDLPEIATEAVESMESATKTMNEAAEVLGRPRDMTRRGPTAQDEAARMRDRLPDA